MAYPQNNVWLIHSGTLEDTLFLNKMGAMFIIDLHARKEK